MSGHSFKVRIVEIQLQKIVTFDKVRKDTVYEDTAVKTIILVIEIFFALAQCSPHLIGAVLSLVILNCFINLASLMKL